MKTINPYSADWTVCLWDFCMWCLDAAKGEQRKDGHWTGGNSHAYFLFLLCESWKVAGMFFFFLNVSSDLIILICSDVFSFLFFFLSVTFSWRVQVKVIWWGRGRNGSFTDSCRGVCEDETCVLLLFLRKVHPAGFFCFSHLGFCASQQQVSYNQWIVYSCFLSG